MKLHELYNDRLNSDLDLVIPITLPYTTCGSSPCVNISYINVGFDWNHGKMFLEPEFPLCRFDDDLMGKVIKLNDSNSRLEYENRNLKNDIKKLKQKISEMELK